MTIKENQELRTCIFCGQRPLSKEHFWSGWIGKILNPRAPDSKREEGFMVRTERTKVIKRIVKSRPGHVTTKQIRVVCETCNNRWMSGMEEAVKPVLAPLLEFGQISLSEADKQTLARWITLKVMVAEHNTPNLEVSSQEDLTRFMEERHIPEGTYIWIGRTLSIKWRSAFARQTATLSTNKYYFEKGRPQERNVHYCAIGIGELFVIFGFCKDIQLNRYLHIDRQMIPIWPRRPGNIFWPPSSLLSTEECDRMAMLLDAIIQSKVTIWQH